MIALDDGSKQNSSALDKQIDKIIQNASALSENALSRKATLRNEKSLDGSILMSPHSSNS